MINNYRKRVVLHVYDDVRLVSLIIHTGDLIPRHMKVFKNNEFFAGLSIPEPDVRESIESKMPRDFSIDGMDFLKVS